MTVFLTLAEFKARLTEQELLSVAGDGQWNSPEGRSIDEPKVQTALDHACELIAGYVFGQYPQISNLADENQPAVLKTCARDIARYSLRSEDGNAASVTDDIRARYEDAIKLLKSIQRGEYELPIVGDSRSADSGAGRILTGQAPAGRVDTILEGYR